MRPDDRADFPAFYRQYGDRLYRFCYRLCGSTSDAEDLTQDVDWDEKTVWAMSRGQYRQAHVTTWFDLETHRVIRVETRVSGDTGAMKLFTLLVMDHPFVLHRTRHPPAVKTEPSAIL